MKLNTILAKRAEEGTKERKLVFKHHQTVDPLVKAPQVGRGLSECPSTNFQLQILII